MNKYQNALNEIMNCAGCLGCTCENVDLLQEIVDKATAKKVIALPKKEYGYTHECPNCEKLVGTIVMSKNNEFRPYIEEDCYCPSCGQALDWSEEE